MAVAQAANLIKVIKDVDALEAIKAKPEGFLDAKVRKDTSGKVKEFNGTVFCSLTYNVGNVKTTGWFSTTEDIPVRGIADPANKEDSRNKHAGTRNQLEMKLSKSGPFGQFLHHLNPVFNAKVDELNTKKELIKGARKVHELVVYKYHEEHPSLAGQDREDPVFRVQIEDGIFPNTFKPAFLSNQPKTVFYDYDTKYTDARGVEQYKLATIKNDQGVDELVNIANMHKFITNGAILKKGSRIMMPSIARSQSWVSLPIIVNKAIIQKRPEATGFDDEGFDGEDMNAVRNAYKPKPNNTNTETITTVNTDTQVQTQVQTPEPIGFDEQLSDINAALENI